MAQFLLFVWFNESYLSRICLFIASEPVLIGIKRSLISKKRKSIFKTHKPPFFIPGHKCIKVYLYRERSRCCIFIVIIASPTKHNHTLYGSNNTIFLSSFYIVKFCILYESAYTFSASTFNSIYNYREMVE